MRSLKSTKNKITRLTKDLTDNLPEMAEPAAQVVLDTVEVDPWTGLTEQQKRIQALKLRGISRRVMATALNCSESTIQKELEAIRAVHKKKGSMVDTEEYVGETLSIYEELMASGWKGLSKLDSQEDFPGSQQLKLQYLGFISQQVRDKTKMLMELGFLRKAKIEIEHSLASPDLDKQLEKEKEQAAFEERLKSLDKNQLATALLSAGLATLPDPTPDIEDADIDED